MVDANKLRIVFLCSGGGGNLAFIHHAAEQEWIKGRIVAVFTDRQCQANLVADRTGLTNRCIDFKDLGQATLLRELELIKPDVVVTTVHKILCDAVVDAFRGKLINLHYSLLPAFGGLIGEHSVRAAIKYGTRFTGTTAHLVDESIDGGRPLVQAVIPLLREENNFGELMNLVFRCGCVSLMGAIDCISNDRHLLTKLVQVEMMGRQCLINGMNHEIPEMTDELFWQIIAQKASVRE